ncbi:MAG TPA: patatin-like phospholipase family protein [Candidatus Alectryocaccomicrobium excrementavium]|uniref:Patatin-like phospholipase family protein n=1 Tax=Candidatus Alectryocaccomicrobium excrementavium TaxID=2840668 RepID=A0A9D1G1I1_9FIRM|nr:patatin-like phospholipase family protein [Candidatus Alectryocaccomicrobium excrementavium]
MLGLVLEGGGARGAFQIGAFQALNEKGFRFDGVAGTSIGAINGALLAQGDFELALAWWRRLNVNMLFDTHDERLDRLLSLEFDRDTLSYIATAARELVEKRGLDTAPIRRLLNLVINEPKLRAMNTDFGIVTVNLTDLKHAELFKEDIPRGKLVDYLMASANLPVFRLEPLDGKVFIDGGFYDNCPLNMLARRGYTQLVAVRTLSLGRSRKFEYPQVQVLTIQPAEPLGPVLGFDPKYTLKNLKMGYRDAMRAICHMAGTRFCIQPVAEAELVARLLARASASDGEMDARQYLFQKTLPSLARALALAADAPCSAVVYALLERMAGERKLDALEIRSVPQLAGEILTAPRPRLNVNAVERIIRSVRGEPVSFDEEGEALCRMLIE